MSFWVPGQVGSFVALSDPEGWSLPMSYYYANVTASDSQNFRYGSRLTAGMESTSGFFYFQPTYAYPQKISNGQLALGLRFAYGTKMVSARTDLTTAQTPAFSNFREDQITGMSDLSPIVSMKWNEDSKNSLLYFRANLPTGEYKTDRLANMGLGRVAFDLGGGATYFDEKKEREYSWVFGMTYNFENPNTDYQSGISAHLDLASAQFVSDRNFLGLVAYFYEQIGSDTGPGALLGDFKSQVAGIGPQAGTFIPAGKKKLLVHFKGYYEFAASNRPAGWNTWLNVVIPL
ncbi:MAG: transporter [Pseudobdellovibrionaceae bacterium]